MKNLHESTIEELHGLTRDELILMLVAHDRDGEYADDHRIALGNDALTYEQALSLAIYNLDEVNS